jgi:hypothetical protein
MQVKLPDREYKEIVEMVRDARKQARFGGTLWTPDQVAELLRQWKAAKLADPNASIKAAATVAAERLSATVRPGTTAHAADSYLRRLVFGREKRNAKGT